MKSVPVQSDSEEPLVDTTKALPLHSKKLERQKKKQEKKRIKALEAASLLTLPTEIILEIFTYLQVSEILSLSSVCARFRDLVSTNGDVIGKDIISSRFQVLTKCFPRPVLFEHVDVRYRPALLNPRRLNNLELHRR